MGIEAALQLLYGGTSPWQLFSLVAEHELNISLPCRSDTALDRIMEAKGGMRRVADVMVPKNFCQVQNWCSVFPSVGRAPDKLQS